MVKLKISDLRSFAYNLRIIFVKTILKYLKRRYYLIRHLFVYFVELIDVVQKILYIINRASSCWHFLCRMQYRFSYFNDALLPRIPRGTVE